MQKQVVIPACDIFRRQVRAARVLLDWTQEQLAAKAGVGVHTVARFELGKCETAKTAELIRQTLTERGGLRFTASGVELAQTMRVLKFGGDYTFEGEVVAIFTKRKGARRYVVEDDRGVCLIMNAKQIGIEE